MEVMEVSSEKMNGYISAWCNISYKLELTGQYKGPKWYCYEGLDPWGEGERFSAMDDEEGCCWVETFPTEQLAIDWLLGKCDNEGNYYEEEQHETTNNV